MMACANVSGLVMGNINSYPGHDEYPRTAVLNKSRDLEGHF